MRASRQRPVGPSAPAPLRSSIKREPRRGNRHRQALGFGERQMRAVDAVDDLQVPRQQLLEQFDRPGLQRLRQQRMGGVGQGRYRDLPRFVPAEIVQGRPGCASARPTRQTRVGVVELDSSLLRRLRNWPSAPRWRLTRSCSEAETKKYSLAAAGVRGPRRLSSVRIQEFADRLRARLLGGGNRDSRRC